MLSNVPIWSYCGVPIAHAQAALLASWNVVNDQNYNEFCNLLEKSRENVYGNELLCLFVYFY